MNLRRQPISSPRRSPITTMKNFRDLRHRSITSYEAKQKIKKLATALAGRLRGYARRQLSSSAMRAHFMAPPNGAKAHGKRFCRELARTSRRGSMFG